VKTFYITSKMPLFPVPHLDQLGDKPVLYALQIQADNVSDGYHTMHELYKHRMALNIALFNSWYDSDVPDGYHSRMQVMKSKLHNDGTMFDGYFIVMALTDYGQISYHYKIKYWDKFKIPEVERTPEYDGHTPNDVIERLMKL